jgi:thiamine biosynthesis lipoprotein
MKETRSMMGMPITVEIVDAAASAKDIADVFDYFAYIDEKFSTYRPESEIMKINRGEIQEKDWSDDMAIIFALAEDTKNRTNGFFDIRRPDTNFYDPSGIVKGWAIFQASQILKRHGFKNYYIDAGGDIQTNGVNARGEPWSIGIRHPFQPEKIVKTIFARSDAETAGLGVATSGTYIRGDHIYNPHDMHEPTPARKTIHDSGTPPGKIVSLTVIGPNVYEADRFATAAFAMGARGIRFLESLPGFAGYMIASDGVATKTTSFP